LANGDGIVFFKQNFDGKRAFHEGKFKNGLAHGQGVVYDIEGHVIYSGGFV
jgi:hypothetical protein